MSAAKCTPGPWTQGKYGEVRDANGNELVVEGVALGGKSTEETRANARLIAAAPELLEALQGVETRCASSGYVGQDGQFLKVIRAAIAKATGSQS